MQYRVYVTRIPVVLKRLPVVERAACICFCFFSFTIITIIIFIMTIILNGKTVRTLHDCGVRTRTTRIMTADAKRMYYNARIGGAAEIIISN